ncbi:MAG: gliding motility-associated C-terminal domain-containing protein [Bacteroidetes bacterium]|nr:gliding motility-associated C-terminal domain-containing protein [Bacteroidota bacterium]
MQNKKNNSISGSIDSANFKLLAFIDDAQMLLPEAYLNTANFAAPFTVDHVKNQSNEIFAITCTRLYKDYHRLSKLTPTKTSVIWTDSMQDYKKSVRAIDGSYRTRIYYANGDGSFNFPSLAANNSFVFSYDGKYFSAYNEANGNLLASDSFINHSFLMQSGIYADECNHVYFGGNNGNVRVRYFNGSSFIAKPDIVIPGMTNKGVYEIKYSQVNRLLYVCGDSLIATVVPSQYCSYSDTIVQASLKKGCSNNATITIHNKDTFPYSFVWRDSTASAAVRTVDSTNSTVDSFSGLIAGHWYFVEVIKCPTCGLGSKTFYFKYDSCSTIQNVSICQGKTFTFNNHVYSLAGTYEDTLKSSIGADSFVTTILSIKPTSAFSQTATICQGKVYNFNSKTYSLTGIYKDTFMNYLGCDSIVTTALTVNPISQTNLSPTICEGSTYTNNSKVYAIAGIYRDTLINFKGCDSILTITLNVLPKTYPTIFKTICKNQTWMVGSKSYSTSGIYRDTLLNYLGCDSILTHNLTVLPISTHSQQVSLCDGQTYKVGNSTYSKAGVYVDTLISFRGCDSIETTVISIKNISQSNFKKEICQGEVYAFRSKILQSTGKYIDTLSNQFGCDSIITLDLLVKPVPILSLKKGLSLCEALQDTIQLDAGVYTSYLWMPDGQKTQQITITKAGVYSLEVLNDQGCKAKDSTKVLEVCKPVLFVPNAFSPNGDGRNDVFKVYGAFIKQIHWMVFNRLGELIREGRNMDDTWDGLYHGEPAPNGVYIYTVEAEGQNGDKLEEKGSLTILR